MHGPALSREALTVPKSLASQEPLACESAEVLATPLKAFFKLCIYWQQFYGFLQGWPILAQFDLSIC